MKLDNDKICSLIVNLKGRKKLKPLGTKPNLLVLLKLMFIT